MALPLLLTASVPGCASGPGESGAGPRASRFETDPPGASIYVDGAFVGSTPTSTRLPAKERVTVRAELPGHAPKEATLRRDAEAEAPAGAGWQDVYYWSLAPR